ncbi:MAG: NnrS family protein, partial [Alphaproteobacteria bacterium]
GLCLLGAAILLPDLAATGLSAMLGIHALTVGLAGGMILAVMTRATLGHTGRPLHADRPTTAIYVAANLAAFARIAAEIWPVRAIELIDVSGLLWVGAFALFTLHYGRFLLGVGK